MWAGVFPLMIVCLIITHPLDHWYMSAWKIVWLKTEQWRKNALISVITLELWILVSFGHLWPKAFAWFLKQIFLSVRARWLWLLLLGLLAVIMRKVYTQVTIYFSVPFQCSQKNIVSNPWWFHSWKKWSYDHRNGCSCLHVPPGSVNSPCSYETTYTDMWKQKTLLVCTHEQAVCWFWIIETMIAKVMFKKQLL